MTAPSGFASAATNYILWIDSATPVSQVAFSLSGEFTTSSNTICPFEGLFHASDGTTVPAVKPSVF
jgi:hypothetical protein